MIRARCFSTGRHFKSSQFWNSHIYAPIWSKDELLKVEKTHKEPQDLTDKMAYGAVRVLRTSFDIVSGYSFGKLTENKVFKRAIFLETVAGVPGFVAAILRHLRSLRRMERFVCISDNRDNGWIYTLLQEAENERMHLLTFIKLYKPGVLFRGSVLVAQGVFMNAFFFSYLISPKFCHRFVGYLEEEAVRTYSKILHEIDNGNLSSLKTKPAPEIAVLYWNLDKEATCRDMILAVRADEANHRDVNHTFANSNLDSVNPYVHKKPE